MEKEHFMDRAMRPLLPILAGLLWISGPLFLLSYGWGIKLIYYAAPGWIFAIVVVVNVLVWLGIASLLDMRQGRQNPPNSGKAELPRRF